MPATTSEIVHLLSRTGTRVDPNRVTQLSTMELVDVVNDLCNFSKNPAFALPDKANYVDNNGVFQGYLWERGVVDQWLDQLGSAPTPLQSKLTLFWHGHFAVSNNKVNDSAMMFQYYKRLATLGGGPFETLCQAIAIDEAMITYLDNRANVVGVAQENFARELMELFVLGVNNGYDQSDVREVARAWTGHSLRWDPDQKTSFYEFYPYQHDTKAKTIFGITKNWDGPQVITEMCSGSRSVNASEHIAAKLWAFFAYEQPDAALVTKLGQSYRSVGLNTIEFLKKMFLLPEFYSDRARQGRVKSPIEWSAMVIAALGLKADQTGVQNELQWTGHEFFYPPNVAGWKLNSVWLNESTFWALDGSVQNAAWHLLGNKDISPPLRATFANIAKMTVPAAVDLVAKAFGLYSLSASTRQALERWLTQHRAAGLWNEADSLIRLVAMSTEARLA
jgi:uncharacterized protein (DUF1800 family)